MAKDELTLLRELRADAPAPDRAALAEGRQRLTEAAGRRRRLRGTGGSPRWRPPRRWP
ncbi:hypothetical protein [Streptomyces sp. RKAG290]|uniref:hypothetical protein n=1 Tax=Streptomyces sp. RKAG290 TaxID=2888348 RepID=UPI00203358AD|nr:hypothetical protein [Streptomyces sp. RKAG290]MCM2414827.1 hypothetical protein [Streptomyces sp. RKAG290]